MKKLLLLSLLVLAFAQVFGQSYTVFFSSADGAVWHSNSSWIRSTYNFTPSAPLATDPRSQFDSETFWLAYKGSMVAADRFPGVLGASTGGVSTSTPDIVVIRAGHSIYLTQLISYNGYIILEPGAKLLFNKVNGDKGRLILNATSVIDMRAMPASDIGSGSEFDNGLAANYLELGGEKINGKWINTLPSPIVTSTGSILEIKITPALLKCMTGSYTMGHVWTEADIRALMICAGQNPDSNPNTPQPVELLSYTAKVAGNAVELEWVAAKEWAFSHYEVEFSEDGENYYAAGSVTALGTEYGAQHYSFSHQPGLSGTLYYRLLGVDVDGTVEVKGVKVVRLGVDVFNVYARQGRLHINYNGPADSQVALLDTMGRLIVLTTLTEEGVQTAGLTAGVYLVQLSNKLEKKAQRVVIQ